MDNTGDDEYPRVNRRDLMRSGAVLGATVGFGYGSVGMTRARTANSNVDGDLLFKDDFSTNTVDEYEVTQTHNDPFYAEGYVEHDAEHEWLYVDSPNNTRMWLWRDDVDLPEQGHVRVEVEKLNYYYVGTKFSVQLRTDDDAALEWHVTSSSYDNRLAVDGEILAEETGTVDPGSDPYTIDAYWTESSISLYVNGERRLSADAETTSLDPSSLVLRNYQGDARLHSIRVDREYAPHRSPGRTITIEQEGADPIEITPLSNDEPVEEFYSYGSPDGSSANTGLEERGVSQLFFYEDEEGLSLVVIHDEPDAGSGGEAVFDFDALPEYGSWVVEDDPSHAPDNFGRTRTTWRWGNCCTDGGAYRGGFDDGYTFTIDATFESGIHTWQALSGDAESPERTLLDPNATATIRIGSALDRVQFEYSPLIPETDEEVVFDGSDTEGEVDEYAWDFGDGTAGTGETATYSYDEPGEYEVTLTVRRPDGAAESTTKLIEVSSLTVGQTREGTTINSPVTVQVEGPVEEGYEYHWRVAEKPDGSDPHLLHGENHPERRQPPNAVEKPHATLRPDVASEEPYVLEVEVFDDEGEFVGIGAAEIEVEEQELDDIVDFGVDGADTVSELVELYAPRYHFHSKETYFPTRYEAYAENADVIDLLNVDTRRSLWNVLVDRAGGTLELLTIWQRGEFFSWLVDEFAYDTLVENPSLFDLGTIANDSSTSPDMLYLLGEESDFKTYQTQYPRAIHANVTDTTFAPEADAEREYLAVTYWAFYLFDPKKEGDDLGLDDRFKAWSMNHASDTETVTILIDENGPQWVAAAQHYDGEYVEWEKVSGTDGSASIDIFPARGAHSSFLVNTDAYDDEIPGQLRWMRSWLDSTRTLGGIFSDVTKSGQTWAADGWRADYQYDLVVLTHEDPWGEFEGEFASGPGSPLAEGSTLPQQRGRRFQDPGAWIPGRMLPESEVLDTGRFDWTVVVPHFKLTTGTPTFKLRFFRNPGVKPHTFVTTATVTTETLTGTEETWGKEIETDLGWSDRTTIEIPLDNVDFPSAGLVHIDVEVSTYSSEIATDEDVVYETSQTWPIAEVPSLDIDTPDILTAAAADEETVAPGDTVERSITVANEGDDRGSGLVTLTAIDPDGMPYLDESGGSETVSVGPGESREVTLSWTPDETVPEGEYDLLTEIWAETELEERLVLLDERLESDAITVEKPNGTLSVSTVPPDASVILDDEPLAERTVERPIGPYDVTALHEEFGSETKSATIEEGKTTRIEIDLVGDEPWIGDYTNGRWVVTRGGLNRAERDWSRGEIDEELYRTVEDAYERGEPVYEHRTPADDRKKGPKPATD